MRSQRATNLGHAGRITELIYMIVSLDELCELIYAIVQDYKEPDKITLELLKKSTLYLHSFPRFFRACTDLANSWSAYS